MILIVLFLKEDNQMPQQEQKILYKQQTRQFANMYIDDKMTIVRNRIAELRRERNIKQTELADLLCVNVTYLYRVETQQANMSIDLLIATARILDVSVDDLIVADVPMSVEAKRQINELERKNKELSNKLNEINNISSI